MPQIDHVHEDIWLIRLTPPPQLCPRGLWIPPVEDERDTTVVACWETRPKIAFINYI